MRQRTRVKRCVLCTSLDSVGAHRAKNKEGASEKRPRRREGRPADHEQNLSRRQAMTLTGKQSMPLPPSFANKTFGMDGARTAPRAGPTTRKPSMCTHPADGWAREHVARSGRSDADALSPSPRTNRTRRVPHPVLIGHVASLYSRAARDATPCPLHVATCGSPPPPPYCCPHPCPYCTLPLVSSLLRGPPAGRQGSPAPFTPHPPPSPPY